MNNIFNLAEEREKRVVEVVITGDDVDFEQLKDFLDTIEPDDYEMRMDALSLSVAYWSRDCYYYGPESVLNTAKEFYEFLKEG
jgi:hypothetical protein